MPVSTDCGQPPAKRCKYCDESTHGVDDPALWRLTLDEDLLDTLTRRFPTWFDSNNNNSNNNNHNNISNSSSPETINSITSPPQIIDPTSYITGPDKYYTVSLADINGMAEGDGLLISTSSSGLINIEDVVASNNLLANEMHNSSHHSLTTERQSPPKAVVDSSPLQPAMDKNKESLKVKLMVRRPINQLVEQGIIPPLKTSPAIHEQRKQLERAKTGDLLRAKIQQRPDRQELERRHILEHEESHVDPSLAEKQRMLKKARLADQLNSQISHRPGPLELIKKNILHTEEPIERIVKEGLVSFKATSEGILNRPQQPNGYITYEDDSQSSEGDLRQSPLRTTDVLEAAAASAGIVTVALTIPTSGGPVVVTSAPVLQTNFFPTIIAAQQQPAYVPPPPPPPPIPIFKSEPIQIKTETSNLFAELCQSVVGNSNIMPLVPSPVSLSSNTSTLSPLSSISSPPSSYSSTINNNLPTLISSSSRSQLQQSPHQNYKSDAPGKDKNRKKCKIKPVAKSRTIKFHEYKGPPSAQKSNSSSSSVSNEETSYQLLLKQQTFLLEYLEGLHKHPTILPANHKQIQAEINSFQQNTNNFILQQQQHQQQQQQLQQQSMASPAPSVSSSIPASPAPSYTDSIISELGKLEKMKVSDLKLLLKKRNLPVSGPKPQLIERLRPHLPLDSCDASTSETNDQSDLDALNSPNQSLSPESEAESMDCQQIDSPCPMSAGRQTPQQFQHDDLLREQQRKIDELQRKLKESQQELLHMRQIHPPALVPTNSPILIEHSAALHPIKTEVINQKLVFKQQLEAKIQKEKLQKEHLAFQQAKNQGKHQGNLQLRNQSPVLIAPKEEKNNNIQLAFKNNGNNNNINQQQQQQQQQQQAIQLTTGNKNKNLEFVWNGEQTVFLLPIDTKQGMLNGFHNKSNTMSGILVPISAAPINVAPPIPPPLPPMEPIKIELVPQMPQLHHLQPPPLYQAQPPPLHPQLPKEIIVPATKPPPPLYEEATKQLEDSKKVVQNKKHIKSQQMTDVLEILIKNGELPETAAFDPTTPTTPANLPQTIVFNAPPNLLLSQTQQQSNIPIINTEKHNLKLMLDATASPSSVSNSESEPQLGSLSPFIDSIEMLSPMQPDCCDDSVNSFDIFLEQQQQKHQAADDLLEETAKEQQRQIENEQQQQQQQQQQDNKQQEQIQKQESPIHNEDHLHHHHQIDLKPFDDLMELMNHPLDMDIGDENQYLIMNHLNKSVSTNYLNQHSTTKPSRRDMNPSLQPSLNELIMQQQQQQQHQQQQLQQQHNFNMYGLGTTSNNNNNNNHYLYNNNHHHSTPMDIEDFENSLSNFDFTSIGHDDVENDQHHLQMNTPQHQHSSFSPQLEIQSNLSSNSIDASTTSNSHYDPPLAQLSHNENILDLFNIDDFKMANDTLSWNEVDFAV